MPKHTEPSKRTPRKRIKLESDEKLFVGVDVHRKTYAVALFSESRGLIKHWSQPAKARDLVTHLDRIKGHVQRVVYEAGPTGFGLVRALREAGYKADVIVTSQVLRTSNNNTKSDRLDCGKLAEHACKDLLKSVYVPSEQQEQDRQLVRLRERMARKQRLARQQIKSFLLNHNIEQPPGLSSWSEQGFENLKALDMHESLRYCFDILIEDEKHARGQIVKLNGKIKKLIRERRHRKKIDCLRSVPGVGVLTAITFVTELIDAERFNDAGEVARSLGLAPRVYQSGDRRREGSMMKDGNERVRTILIEAAWRWVAVDERGRRCYSRLIKNTGDAKKAIGGAARKLAIIMWRLSTRLETYRPLEAEVPETAAA